MGSAVTPGVQLGPLGGGTGDGTGEGSVGLVGAVGEGSVELVGAVGEEPPHATANRVTTAITLRIIEEVLGSRETAPLEQYRGIDNLGRSRHVDDSAAVDHPTRISVW